MSGIIYHNGDFCKCSHNGSYHNQIGKCQFQFRDFGRDLSKYDYYGVCVCKKFKKKVGK